MWSPHDIIYDAITVVYNGVLMHIATVYSYCMSTVYICTFPVHTWAAQNTGRIQLTS